MTSLDSFVTFIVSKPSSVYRLKIWISRPTITPNIQTNRGFRLHTNPPHSFEILSWCKKWNKFLYSNFTVCSLLYVSIPGRNSVEKPHGENGWGEWGKKRRKKGDEKHSHVRRTTTTTKNFSSLKLSKFIFFWEKLILD